MFVTPFKSLAILMIFLAFCFQSGFLQLKHMVWSRPPVWWSLSIQYGWEHPPILIKLKVSLTSYSLFHYKPTQRIIEAKTTLILF